MAKPSGDNMRSTPPSEPSIPSASTSATSVSPESLDNSDDGVFDISDGYQEDGSLSDPIAGRNDMLSDLPAMQRQHMTAGYREGLSDSKAKSMQGGFDEGYPVGFDLGIKVGQIFGVFEGFVAAFAKEPAKMPEGLLDLYGEAKRELSISQLLDGLDDERLGQPEFSLEDLSVESKEILQRWEVTVASMMQT